MFRKFWKTLKFFIIIAVILICLPHSILPHQSSDSARDDLGYYLNQNETETRLPEFKDNPEAVRLKLIQLEVINKSRRKYNATPVKLDILASRVANKICREASENNYVGHWNLAGEKPYHRYAFAGGYDHVSENAYGEWSSDEYTISETTISEMMKSGHASFMSERSPNDGHKKTIINKSHNFIGIGYHFSGKQFRYYEEFIDRYLEFENIPSEVKTGESFSITVKTAEKSFLYFVIVYHENLPVPLSPAQINKKGSYQDFTNSVFMQIFPWDLSKYRNGNLYKIPLKFTSEGLYYIQIFTDKKEITSPGSFNTKGMMPQSGIVIKATKE